MCKWTHAVEILIVQGSAVVWYSNFLIYIFFCFVFFVFFLKAMNVFTLFFFFLNDRDCPEDL